jgi:hypothetical protein
MYSKTALKRVVYEVPYLLHFMRNIPDNGIWRLSAGQYTFNAVVEFTHPYTVRIVAYESSLNYMTAGASVDWFLNRFYNPDHDFEHAGWEAYQRNGIAVVNLEWLQSMERFPLNHLPLLLGWEKRYPRFESLLKGGTHGWFNPKETHGRTEGRTQGISGTT